MSSAGSNLGGYAVTMAVVNIAFLAAAVLRPKAAADANRAFIESGEESYFEQRRAWKAYGTTPETDPDRLRRRAMRFIALNLVLVAAFAVTEWLL